MKHRVSLVTTHSAQIELYIKDSGYVTQNKYCYEQLRALCIVVMYIIYWPMADERKKDKRCTSSVVVDRRASIPGRHQPSASSAHDTAACKQVLIFNPGLWLHATRTHKASPSRHLVLEGGTVRVKQMEQLHATHGLPKHVSKCKRVFGEVRGRYELHAQWAAPRNVH